jgi:hypothetical protein
MEVVAVATLRDAIDAALSSSPATGRRVPATAARC